MTRVAKRLEHLALLVRYGVASVKVLEDQGDLASFKIRVRTRRAERLLSDLTIYQEAMEAFRRTRVLNPRGGFVEARDRLAKGNEAVRAVVERIKKENGR